MNGQAINRIDDEQ